MHGKKFLCQTFYKTLKRCSAVYQFLKRMAPSPDEAIPKIMIYIKGKHGEISSDLASKSRKLGEKKAIN